MYDELVKRLRNRRMCVQALGTLNDYPLLGEAADAIEELQRRVKTLTRELDEANQDADYANDAATALYGALPRWIPVTERLPEENGNYLVAVKFPRGKWVEICACDGRDWVSVDEYAEYATEWVTHWMPLPEPPKEE